MIFKLGGNRTFVYFEKFIGLYYSQVLIHVKFICNFVMVRAPYFGFSLFYHWWRHLSLYGNFEIFRAIHHSTHKPVKSISEPPKGETAAINLTLSFRKWTIHCEYLKRFVHSKYLNHNYHNKKKITIKCGPGLPGGP